MNMEWKKYDDEEEWEEDSDDDEDDYWDPPRPTIQSGETPGFNWLNQCVPAMKGRPKISSLPFNFLGD